MLIGANLKYAVSYKYAGIWQAGNQICALCFWLESVHATTQTCLPHHWKLDVGCRRVFPGQLNSGELITYLELQLRDYLKTMCAAQLFSRFQSALKTFQKLKIMVDHDKVKVLRISRCAGCYLVMLQCYQSQALSFWRARPACLLPSFVARDGSNSLLINSSCQCNGGDDQTHY